jgi:hypothetical protein
MSLVKLLMCWRLSRKHKIPRLSRHRVERRYKAARESSSLKPWDLHLQPNYNLVTQTFRATVRQVRIYMTYDSHFANEERYQVLQTMNRAHERLAVVVSLISMFNNFIHFISFPTLCLNNDHLWHRTTDDQRWLALTQHSLCYI